MRSTPPFEKTQAEKRESVTSAHLHVNNDDVHSVMHRLVSKDVLSCLSCFVVIGVTLRLHTHEIDTVCTLIFKRNCIFSIFDATFASRHSAGQLKQSSKFSYLLSYYGHTYVRAATGSNLKHVGLLSAGGNRVAFNQSETGHQNTPKTKNSVPQIASQVSKIIG